MKGSVSVQKNSGVMIGTMEAVSILTISRIFTAVTYSFGGQNSVTDSMIAFSLGFIFDLLIVIPFAVLTKHNNCSIIEMLSHKNTFLGKLLSGFLCVVFLLICASTLASFSLFISSQVLNTTPWPILFLMTISLCYCAFMGIEALGRFSNVILFVTVVSLVAVVFIFLNQYTFYTFYPPFENGFAKVISQSVFQASSLFEILTVTVISPVVNGKRRRGYLWFLILTLLMLQIVIFTISATLGDYASTTTYPFYTLVKIGGISSFERIDSVYVAVWVLLSFIKGGYFLLLSKNMLDMTVKNKKHSLSVITTVTFVVASVFVLQSRFIKDTLSTLKYAALFVIVAIPLLLLIFRKRRKFE